MFWVVQVVGLAFDVVNWTGRLDGFLDVCLELRVLVQADDLLGRHLALELDLRLAITEVCLEV